MPKTAVDVWMDQDFTFSAGTIRRQALALFLLRIPALIPLFFMLRAVLTLNNNTLNGAGADVLGTGAELCLLLTLLVTPVITVTGQRWIAPLRRWYGIMFAVTAITDATIASITSDFAGGVSAVSPGIASCWSASRWWSWLFRSWRRPITRHSGGSGDTGSSCSGSPT